MVTLKVKGSLIKTKGSYQAVADSINYLQLDFVFSDEWKECEYIQVYAESRIDDEIFDRRILNGTQYVVPGELIKVPGFVIGLTGYDVDGSVKITSQKYEVSVKASGTPADRGEPTAKDQSVFEQMVDDMNAAAGKLNYLHIKWANAEPASDDELLDTPADWLGVYCGAEKTAPTAYGAYSWYEVKGEQGSQGLQGIPGEKGERGEKGEKGEQGEQGPQGLKGEKGDKGDKGEKGTQGERGLQGIQGIQGEQGIGIQSIAFKEATAGGNVYTVTLTDGNAYEIVAPRGAAGEGSGDMLSAVYDKNNKATDIFAYADKKAKEVEDKIPSVPTKVSQLENDSGYLTEHQDISGKYEKPVNGIPKSDLSSDVQNSLGKADTALQSHQDISGKYEKPAGGIPKTDLASDVQTSLGKADSALQEHQDISGKANVDLSNVNAESLKAAIEGAGISSGAKTHIVYIEESQNWVVPDGVIEIDVFIVNSGCDGESGKTATTNSYFYLAGSGGNGGAVCYVQNFKVESEQVCPVVVGVNGGISSFCDLTPSMMALLVVNKIIMLMPVFIKIHRKPR